MHMLSLVISLKIVKSVKSEMIPSSLNEVVIACAPLVTSADWYPLQILMVIIWIQKIPISAKENNKIPMKENGSITKIHFYHHFLIRNGFSIIDLNIIVIVQQSRLKTMMVKL